MEAHREHVYQRLTAVPGSPLPAVVTAMLSVAFVASAALPTVATVVAWLFLAAAYVALPGVVGRRLSCDA
jgi:hypothetical protein